MNYIAWCSIRNIIIRNPDLLDRLPGIPVIVVSNDIGNQYSGTVAVIQVTSKNLIKIYPFEIYLPQKDSRLEKNSKGKADQIRTIDKARLIKPIGKLTQGLMGKLDKAIRIHLNLDFE